MTVIDLGIKLIRTAAKKGPRGERVEARDGSVSAMICERKRLSRPIRRRRPVMRRSPERRAARSGIPRVASIDRLPCRRGPCEAPVGCSRARSRPGRPMTDSSLLAAALCVGPRCDHLVRPAAAETWRRAAPDPGRGGGSKTALMEWSSSPGTTATAAAVCRCVCVCTRPGRISPARQIFPDTPSCFDAAGRWLFEPTGGGRNTFVIAVGLSGADRGRNGVSTTHKRHGSGEKSL
jgi:hypothetical protein